MNFKLTATWRLEDCCSPYGVLVKLVRYSLRLCGGACIQSGLVRAVKFLTLKICVYRDGPCQPHPFMSPSTKAHLNIDACVLLLTRPLRCRLVWGAAKAHLLAWASRTLGLQQ